MKTKEHVRVLTDQINWLDEKIYLANSSADCGMMIAIAAGLRAERSKVQPEIKPRKKLAH